MICPYRSSVHTKGVIETCTDHWFHQECFLKHLPIIGPLQRLIYETCTGTDYPPSTGTDRALKTWTEYRCLYGDVFLKEIDENRWANKFDVIGNVRFGRYVRQMIYGLSDVTRPHEVHTSTTNHQGVVAPHSARHVSCILLDLSHFQSSGTPLCDFKYRMFVLVYCESKRQPLGYRTNKYLLVERGRVGGVWRTTYHAAVLAVFGIIVYI